MKEQTDFGFQRVTSAEKTRRVQEVFRDVSVRYDIMNDLMSAGIHRLWKKTFLRKLAPRADTKALDMSSGTCDIAFRILEASPKTTVYACDPSESMLRVGRERAWNKGISNGLHMVVTPAEYLPFADSFFDYYTIAFGLRNVTDREAAISEAFRVLRPGGKFMILEFSPLETGIFQKFYDAYSFNLIPKMGKILTGHSDHYQYLVESIRQFPAPKELAKKIESAGFSSVKFQALSGGIVHIHSGWRV